MASKYMKKCSTSLVTKKVQIKTALRFDLIPDRMALIKGNNNNKCWQGHGKQEPLYIAGGNAISYNHYGKQYGASSENYR
jgi:hypothetical protein